MSDSVRTYGLHHARVLCPWVSPGKNIGMDWHAFLQEIFLIQGSNPDLFHCRQILYLLRHQVTSIPYHRDFGSQILELPLQF